MPAAQQRFDRRVFCNLSLNLKQEHRVFGRMDRAPIGMLSS